MFSKISESIAVAAAYDKIPTGWKILDVRGLIDGKGNSRELFDSYVKEGVRILTQGSPEDKIVVVCDYGQSRSNLVAAQIYSETRSVPIGEAVATVKSLHPDSKIKPSLMSDFFAGEEKLNNQRVAVSGGEGFIGSLLCHRLEELGVDCLALSRKSHGDYLNSAESLKAVLLDFQPSKFVHLAHPKPYNSEETLQLALSQLVSVATFCEDEGISLAYPSGWVVFDGHPANEVTSTSSPVPHTRYGRLKATIESYLSLSSEGGLDVKILRLPALFGEGSLEPRYLQYFANCAAKGQDIVYHDFSNGSARVPLVPVSACADALASAVLQYESLPLVTHIGSADLAPTVGETAHLVAEWAGIHANPTPVARPVFTGHFCPDLEVSLDSSPASLINSFLIQLYKHYEQR